MIVEIRNPQFKFSYWQLHNSPLRSGRDKKKKKGKKRLSVAALCVDSLEAAAEDDMTMKLNSV